MADGNGDAHGNGPVDGMVRDLRVQPGTAAHLAGRDPGSRLGLDDRDVAHAEVEALITELDGLHNKLWAEASRSVLLVLQGMDTAGKDGTIRRVLSGLNPQGCEVVSFKTPSTGELEHDYLWRVHASCPARGRLGVFNRSHYEDVVVVRQLGLLDDDGARRRYRHIVDFERILAEEGTTVVKVFLHISKGEQRRRLQERLDDPTKQWKFRSADLEVRARWGDYQAWYEEAITHTSSEHAPWYVVPGDHKWVRDVAVARLLVATFRRLDPQLPPADAKLGGLRVE